MSAERVAGRPTPLRVVTWNIEWARRTSPRGRVIAEQIEASQPDLVCLTEAHTDFFTTGHVVTSGPDYGYGKQESRRKVVLWSPRPWTNVDPVGDADLPSGRIVAATTSTSAGPVRVVGVCVPWKDAHVRSGRRDRQPWEDHASYLRTLPSILSVQQTEPVVLAGDFNQAIPRQRAPRRVFEVLQSALVDVECVTAGELDDAPRPAIDHLCHGAGLACTSISILSDVTEDGQRLSDHFGIVAELEFDTVARPNASVV